MNNQTIAVFLCEYNETTAKFCTMEGKLIEKPTKLVPEPLQVGRWFQMANDGIRPDFCGNSWKQIKVLNKNDDVFSSVLAYRPQLWTLPDEIREKYNGEVWSPYLKFLGDPRNLFNDSLKEARQVTVKYAPSEKYNFEIIEVGPLEIPKANSWQHEPWSLDRLVPNMENLVPHDIKRNKEWAPNCSLFSGICIDFKMFDSSENHREAYCVLFNTELGLVRWLPGIARKYLKEKYLGQSFQFKLNDTLRKFPKIYQPDPRQPVQNEVLACTATEVKPIVPLLPSCVLNGTLLIETSFVYNTAMFEEKEPHFWNFHVGRVEVNMHGTQIKNRIKNYWDSLEVKDEAEHDSLKNDKIVVIVNVRLLTIDYEPIIFDQYPNKGIFAVEKILKMVYQNSGEVIPQI